MKTLTVTFIAAAVFGSALTGCATTRHSDQLDEARAQVATLSQEPLAQQAAADDLRAAQDRLQQAQTAEEQRRPPAEVDHLAYLAERHAQAGEARVHTMAAQQELARQQQQRTQILLASREQQAQANAQQAEANAQQAATAQEQLRQTQQELADLKAKPTDRGPTITLGDVLFDTGAATLKPGADLSIDRLADYLKAHSQTRVLIEGHTDSRGSEEYNEALSLRRAGAVAAALRERGVPGDAIQTIGRGKAYPVATNDTDAGRQQNRRVEIVLSDANGRFAQSASPPVG
jgi:outer membrane protein OmpA-like peptidoglycan-associated protein